MVDKGSGSEDLPLAPSTRTEPALDWHLTRQQHLALIGIGILALVLRGLYLWGQARNNPFFELVRGDAFDHDAWARAIAVGPGMEAEPYYRAPFYYYGLALLYSTVGPSIIWARIAGACLGALTSYGIARLGAALGGYRAGWIAGSLAAVYWPAIYFDGELLTVGLECLLVVGLMLALMLATSRNSLPLFALSGVVWGLSLVTRPNFLALAPAIGLWLFIALPGARWASRKWWAAAVVAISAVCIVAPVSLRNAWVGGEPVFIAYSGGINFYIGNNPESDGISAVLPDGRRSLRGGYEDAHRIPEAELGHSLSRQEISDYWYAKSFEWIKANPTDFAAHMLKKFRLFWSPVELPNNQPIRFFAERSEISSLFIVGFPLIAIFGLAGFVLVADRWKRWVLPGSFLLLYMATVVLFFCNARYRLPVYPLLILAAAGGLSRLPGLVRERRFGLLGLSGCVGLAAAWGIATNPPPDRAAFHQAMQGEGHKYLGDLYAGAPLSDRERHGLALAHYEEAVRLKPGSPYLQLALAREQRRTERLGSALSGLTRAVKRFPENAEIRLEWAQALAASGRAPAALEQFEAAVDLQPASGAAQLGLGCALKRGGRYRQALAPLGLALRLETDPVATYLCRGEAHLGLGDRSAALADFGSALELDPRSARALQRSGDVHLLAGRTHPAIAHYRLALRQNPDLPGASQNMANALRGLGQYAETIAVLESAVQHRGGDPGLLASLAFTLASAPQSGLRRGEAALRYANRALAAEPSPNSRSFDAQGAALAELGRFPEAQEAAARALEIARAQGRSDRVPALEARLDQYRAARPHRAGPMGVPAASPGPSPP